MSLSTICKLCLTIDANMSMKCCNIRCHYQCIEEWFVLNEKTCYCGQRYTQKNNATMEKYSLLNQITKLLEKTYIESEQFTL